MGSDLGEEIGAENTECHNRNEERDHEINKRCDHRTDLQVDACDRHLELSHTLASGSSGCEEWCDDTLGERGKELGHNRAEVDGGGDDDNILGVEHFICKTREKTDSFWTDVWKLKMDPEEQVMNAIYEYQSCPTDALATLRYYYDIHPDREDDSSEIFAEQTLAELMYEVDYLRDNDGYVLVEESIEYAKREIDDLFYYMHSNSFNRTMNRMKKLKEELMEKAWHPHRIERILELGGYDALDNFAGV